MELAYKYDSNLGGDLMSSHGEVKTWFMTPEELREYVEKNPIRPTKRANKNTRMDYKWRPEKAVAARKKKGLI